MALAESYSSRGDADAFRRELGALDLSGAFWSEPRVAGLRIMWREGLSATQIAKKLGNVSRNAVIGKVHRLGLAGRATPSRPTKKLPRVRLVRTQRLPKPAPPTPAEARAAEAARALGPTPNAEGARYNVLTIGDGLCRFPIGDPKNDDFGFCAREARHAKDSPIHGCPYCVEHAKLAYAEDPFRPNRRKKQKRLDAHEVLLDQLTRGQLPQGSGRLVTRRSGFR